MPKINVYLPDELAAAVRSAGISVSPICQHALAEAVQAVGDAREAADALRAADFDPRRHARLSSRMTVHLRHALDRAREAAGPRGAISGEHLLIGVIDEPDNLGAHVLQSLGVDLVTLRNSLVRAPAARGRRTPKAKPPSPPGRQPQPLEGLSTAGRLVIAAALEVAIDLGHAFIGCEHLVAGVAEAGGPAAEPLRNHGIGGDSIRRAIPPALAAAALGYSNAPRMPASAGRLDEIDRRLDEIERRLEAGGF